MSKNMFVFLSCVICLCFNDLFADSYIDNCSQIQYVTVEQIMLTPEGIFVMVDGEHVPVRSISYSGEGYYCFPTKWTCPRCQTVNGFYRLKCKRCGYSGF
jgi:hypothetical protein